MSECDNLVNIDEQAGCSSVFDKYSNDVPNKIENTNDVEERNQTKMQAVEEGSGDEFDGVSQCTDDSMKDDEQWSEEYNMSKVTKIDLYTIDQINAFLDETKGKSVKVGDFFPDLDKFVASVMWARKVSSDAELSQQKRYRLKKHITAVRKGKGKPKKGKNN